MEKEIVIQVQEAQRVAGTINPRRNTPRNIEIKLTKIIESNKGKMTNNTQGNSHKVNS